MLAYTSGFKCQCPNIFSLAIARPTREIVHQYVVYRNEDLHPLLKLIFLRLQPKQGFVHQNVCCKL